VCVFSGAIVGGGMIATQEAARRRREAFMRKGDQVLHRLLSNPDELSELKRVSRMPDEAVVWFVIVHVGGARFSPKLQGERLRTKLKHGGQGWSVARETHEVVAMQLPREQRVAAVQPPPGPAMPVSAESALSAASNPSASASPAPITRFNSSTTQDWPGGEFDSTCLFIWSVGLAPQMRLRLQKNRWHGRWKTVGWAEHHLGVEAGRAGLEEVECKFMSSKAASRQIQPGEVVGTAALVIETRAMFVGDLRKSGISVGSVVAPPLPGQDDFGVVQGVPVERAAAADTAIAAGQAAAGRRRRRRLAALPEDDVSVSSDDSYSPSAVSDSSEGSSEGEDSMSGDSDEGESPMSSLRRVLTCQCR